MGRYFRFSTYSRLVNVLLVAICFSVHSASAEPLRQTIDREVEKAWKENKLSPAPVADDATFLRRIYLDLCGTIPTFDQAKLFLADEDPAKREKLIDRLLDDPRYAQQQADFWDQVYFGRNPPGFDARTRPGFQRWLREQFAQNTPYDVIARTILKAEGNTAQQGAPMYLVQYRNKPADAAESVTQIFLGVQLQCARCHDHPFESWTQLDFYGMAAFLARLQVVDLGKKKENEKMMVLGEKNTGEVEFTGPASESEPGKKGKPVAPKFLLVGSLEEPDPPKDLKEPRNFPGGKVPPAPAFSRKNSLAEWVTAADNPYFARALANRVWAQYLGKGLVHPVDNMSESNPASHEELLAALSKGLVEHKFDLKWYIRELVNSKTYQLATSGPVEDERPHWFERGRARPLSAEELVQAWRVATNYAAADKKTKEQLDKGNRFYPISSGYQLRVFGKPTDGVGNFLGGLHEHLFMNNGGLGKIFNSSQGSLLHTLAEGKEPWPQRVERLYLSVLSRRPTDEENEKFVAYLSAEERPHDRLREAVWTLLTCSEFRFNH